MLDPGHAICRPRGVEVGIVGTKGFMGGFPGSHVSNFGEPSMRALYEEATVEVDALEAGLAAVATCPVRIVLVHYAPIEATLRGEPEGIWTYLGTDRLAAPIVEHEPDLVLHGHAHRGTESVRGPARRRYASDSRLASRIRSGTDRVASEAVRADRGAIRPTNLRTRSGSTHAE